MTIDLRPHQISQVAAALSRHLNISNVYGSEVQGALNEVVKEISTNPNTEIKVVGSNGTLCVAGCRVRNDTFEFCEGIGTEEYEEEIANNLGVKIGVVYKAKDIASIRNR